MRILSWNVNSLLRLLNHPLHYVLNKRRGLSSDASPPISPASSSARTAAAAAAPDAGYEGTQIASNVTEFAALPMGTRLKQLLDALNADIICFQVHTSSACS